MVSNLVHFPHQSVREEVASLLMKNSEFFIEEDEALMEIQKINPKKANEQDLTLNFNEFPNKSQK